MNYLKKLIVLVVVLSIFISCSELNGVKIEEEADSLIKVKVYCNNPHTYFTQDKAHGWCLRPDSVMLFRFYPEQIPITLYSKSYRYNKKFNLFFLTNRDTFTVENNTIWVVKTAGI